MVPVNKSQGGGMMAPKRPVKILLDVGTRNMDKNSSNASGDNWGVVKHHSGQCMYLKNMRTTFWRSSYIWVYQIRHVFRMQYVSFV